MTSQSRQDVKTILVLKRTPRLALPALVFQSSSSTSAWWEEHWQEDSRWRDNCSTDSNHQWHLDHHLHYCHHRIHHNCTNNHNASLKRNPIHHNDVQNTFLQAVYSKCCCPCSPGGDLSHIIITLSHHYHIVTLSLLSFTSSLLSHHLIVTS